VVANSRLLPTESHYVSENSLARASSCRCSVSAIGAPAYNNVVGASARLRRAPEYTARRLRRNVDGGDVVGRNMADERSCLAPRRQPPNVI
jgi:hypothetical protein